MKLISLKCPNCNAEIEVNKDLEKVTCNYCGSSFFIEDEKETKEERIIKAISKKEEKDRQYYASEEYEKKLEVESSANDKTIVGSIGRLIDKKRKYESTSEYKEKMERKNKEDKKYMIIVFSVLLLILIIGLISSCVRKSDSITCHDKNNKKYYLIYKLDSDIVCASCSEEMLSELNEKYNDKKDLYATNENIETYFENIGGYCGYYEKGE